MLNNHAARIPNYIVEEINALDMVGLDQIDLKGRTLPLPKIPNGISAESVHYFIMSRCTPDKLDTYDDWNRSLLIYSDEYGILGQSGLTRFDNSKKYKPWDLQEPSISLFFMELNAIPK